MKTILGRSLEESRIYREIKKEGELQGKLAAAPLLLKAGISIEQIAEELQIDREEIERIVRQPKE